MISRRRTKTLLTGTVAAVMVAMLLSACAPAVEPEPTPTAVFASEEEAFAAAEETYRAYIEAKNVERKGEPGVNSSSFLIGKALEGELASVNRRTEQGVVLAGDTRLVSFDPQESNPSATSSEVAAVVCIDVTDTQILSEAGEDLTPAERATRVALRVEFVAVDQTSMVISNTIAEGVPC